MNGASVDVLSPQRVELWMKLQGEMFCKVNDVTHNRSPTSEHIDVNSHYSNIRSINSFSIARIRIRHKTFLQLQTNSNVTQYFDTLSITVDEFLPVHSHIIRKKSACDLHAGSNTFIKHNDFFLRSFVFRYYSFRVERRAEKLWNGIMKKVCRKQANFISKMEIQLKHAIILIMLFLLLILLLVVAVHNEPQKCFYFNGF